ncbi:nuclear transport factor 2 family protein [Catenulispora sp. NF23]|uniref:Nuclear transport factor 2 family protein n=1 Tax=Catenulispora pinistramenti TaxID=2705254 RepID=A0ABS5L633_9ACTN|nr:nuclear transport factor 2 family protein [Catenulispora pinistramenti]MBS2538779.1 nuclear transport factor 2 family protein [Catenulispora pinistramenti]MBS2553764.1 nuclear transport factor 2 family protein [Catenulispora pinistramenti]
MNPTDLIPTDRIPTDLISSYLEIWNERDGDTRRKLMESVLSDDSVYSDPDYAGLQGHAALSAAIDKAQQQFGDLRFTLGTVLGMHHDQALFTWELGTVATGYDVVEFTPGADTRIRRVVGFFG